MPVVSRVVVSPVTLYSQPPLNPLRSEYRAGTFFFAEFCRGISTGNDEQETERAKREKGEAVNESDKTGRRVQRGGTVEMENKRRKG